MKRKPVFLVLIAFCTLCSSFAAHAWCKLSVSSSGDQPSGTIITSNVTVSPSAIKIPKDIAVGTELYRVTARNDSYQYYRVNCNDSYTYSNYYLKGQFSGSQPALSSWQGSGLGKVYQTGVNGIGMVVLTSTTNQALGQKNYQFGMCYTPDFGNISCNTWTQNSDITFVLIKTGAISVNSINLATFPKVESVAGGDNSPGSDFAVFRAGLTGTISFTQATCALAEASKSVNLGEYKVSVLAAANSFTPWAKASIELINCNYGGAQAYKYYIRGYSSNSTVTTIGSPNTANATWSLKLTPGTTIIDDAKGIMAIGSDSESASGVGIQLSSTNTTAGNPIKFSQPRTGTMVTGTNATMTIPLYARYIKTGSTVKPGKANGKVTYLIEYK